MRNTQEVFESHLMFTLDWNMESDIEENYSEDCIVISSYGTFFGKEGIRKALELLESQIPESDLLYTTKVWRGEIAFLEWQAESDDFYVDDGASTYVIQNGKIVGQTIHYSVKARER